MNTNYIKVKEETKDVNLVVVTKKRSKEEILEYYNIGERHFGENKAQELHTKLDLPSDIQWHFIGHLQTNKVKDVVPYVTYIDSVDSLKLLKEISKQAIKHNKTMKVLIQLNIAHEETKSGLYEDEIEAFLQEAITYPNVQIRGFMAMGPHVDDTEEIKKVFKQVRQLFDTYKVTYHLTDLSMGMSQDYNLAIECGSTEVRIGKLLFI